MQQRYFKWAVTVINDTNCYWLTGPCVFLYYVHFHVV